MRDHKMKMNPIWGIRNASGNILHVTLYQRNRDLKTVVNAKARTFEKVDIMRLIVFIPIKSVDNVLSYPQPPYLVV